MAPVKKEDTLYIRNVRPNMLVIKYNGVRYNLTFRGHREDSLALPIEAESDPTIARWIKEGRLEKIDKEDYMRLAARQIDQLRPDQTVPRSQRKGHGIAMHPETSRTPFVVETFGKEHLTPNLEYAGEVVSTKEELDILEEQGAMQGSRYRSKYRDNAEFNMR